MLNKRRLISLILTLFMLCSYIPSVSAASDTKVIFTQGFNTLPTNSGAPSNVSAEGGSSIMVIETEKENKALEIGLNDASAKLSFPVSASNGTIWLGARFKLTDNIESGSMFQITSSTGTKLNLINIKERSASLYDGKVFTKLTKKLWTDIHIKLNYDKKIFSVYVDGKCAIHNWKISRTIPAASRIGFEFSNTDKKSSIQIDHLVAYTGSSLLRKYPAEKFNPAAGEEEVSTEAKISRVYLFEDYNSLGFNASSNSSTAFEHKIGVRNLQGRSYAGEKDRMYNHMERIAGVSNYPHFEVPIKDFDATNYVVDMTLNIFELSGVGFELTLKKSNTTRSKLLTAEENGILKCNGAIFNQFDFNKWNRLSFVINAVSSTYDVYVNGVKVKEKCSVSADLKDINQVGFQLIYGTGGGSIGLDEIAVYEGNELKPEISLKSFTGNFVNSYDAVDKKVTAFIGDKAVFCLNNSAFYKDGKKTKYKGEGYETFDGIPMGSVEAMASAYGISYTYDESTKTVTLGNGNTLTVGYDSYIINGTSVSADGNIEEKDGIIYAPAKSFFDKMLGKTVSYDRNWLLLFISEDNSFTSTEDSAMMQQIMYMMIYDRPSGEEMSRIISERFPNNEHPRALFTTQDLERVKREITTDEYSKKLYDYLKLNADSILGTNPVGFTINASGELTYARTQENRITDLGIMYHLSGDERYAERAIKEIEAMVKMPYLGWGKALNSGAVMAAFTRGYDMFYHKLTPELRTQIEDCVISLWERDLLDGSNASGGRNFNYMHTQGNWVPVHNGPYLESTLVFADNSRMADLAKKQFEISQRSFEGALADLAPDGACPEGAGYWLYNMFEWAPAVKTLMNCLGSSLGVEDHIGLKKSCYFMMDLQGTAGVHGFHDSGAASTGYNKSRAALYEQSRAVFVIADMYKDAGLLNSWLSKIDNFYAEYNGTSLMWYNSELAKSEVKSSLDNRYRGELDFIALRSSHEDENAIVLTAHSGKNYMSHSHIDGGTYQFDAMGYKWACDVGTEVYGKDYDPIKAKYYVTRPEAHNLYLINPRAGYQGQDPYAEGATIEFESSDKGGYAIVDMSKYYAADVVTAQRGFKLDGNRSYLIVRDEMNLKAPSDIISFVHTMADIEIIDNNRAIFKQFGKKVLVEVMTNGRNLSLDVMPCEMLPTSPEPQPDANDLSKYRKLAMKLNGSGNITISVKFTPLYDDRITSTFHDDTALALWKVTEGKNDLPFLTAIYADGKELEGFNPNNRQILLPVTAGVSKAPVITAKADDIYNVEVIQDTSQMLTEAIIILTDKQNPDNKSYYTVNFQNEGLSLDSLDGLKLADIKAITKLNTGSDLTSALTDGNFKTEAYESGGGVKYLIDLGAVYNIDSVITAFAQSDLPYRYTFDVELSEDGNNFTSKTGICTGDKTGYESFKLGENVKARYIRICPNGRNTSWVSRLCEVAVAIK